MTTAHKPTYHPAIGRVHQGGYRFDVARAQFSSRQLPAHMTLKARTDLVNKQKDQEALKKALFDSEQKHRQGIADEQSRQGIIPASSSSPHAAAAAAPPDADSDDDARGSPRRLSPGEGGGGELPPGEGGGAEVDLSQFDDEDDAIATRPGENSDEDDDDDDDSDDEDAELARELELIRREREQARLKAAQVEAAQAEAAAEQQLHSNPLLSLGGNSASAASSAGVKRRWDDDVVFRNQAPGDARDANKKRFINDVIRSDFHRSFLKRYVK